MFFNIICPKTFFFFFFTLSLSHTLDQHRKFTIAPPHYLFLHLKILLHKKNSYVNSILWPIYLFPSIFGLLTPTIYYKYTPLAIKMKKKIKNYAGLTQSNMYILLHNQRWHNYIQSGVSFAMTVPERVVTKIFRLWV